MSPDGDLVLAGAGRLLQLWHRRDDRGAVAELPEHLGEANAVTFNQDVPGCFMVTCDRNVAFMCWGSAGGGPQVQPGQLVTRCPGRLLDSVYLRGTTNAISVSDKGALPCSASGVTSPTGPPNDTPVSLRRVRRPLVGPPDLRPEHQGESAGVLHRQGRADGARRGGRVGAREGRPGGARSQQA